MRRELPLIGEVGGLEAPAGTVQAVGVWEIDRFDWGALVTTDGPERVGETLGILLTSEDD